MWGEGTVMTVRLFPEEVVSDEGGVVVETFWQEELVRAGPI